MINYYKIDHFFKYVHGVSNNEASGKIKEEKKLISLINAERKKILLVGDTNHDSEVAEVLGIDCILIYSGHQSVKILQKSCRKIINNFEELLKYLKTYKGMLNDSDKEKLDKNPLRLLDSKEIMFLKKYFKTQNSKNINFISLEKKNQI